VVCLTDRPSIIERAIAAGVAPFFDSLVRSRCLHLADSAAQLHQPEQRVDRHRRLAGGMASAAISSLDRETGAP
jgi:hypothetical protein